MFARLLFCTLVVLASPTLAAAAESLVEGAETCRSAVSQAEKAHGIPRQLLAAIAVAESGRWNGDEQASSAWPWTVYAEGRGRYLPTKQAAIAEVKGLKARGIRNIDVGCMQVNLEHHGHAFATLEEALDPIANATYAARFLKDLQLESRSWGLAVSYYHSRTDELNRPYRVKVLKLWNDERQRVAEEARQRLNEELQRRRAKIAALRESQSVASN